MGAPVQVSLRPDDSAFPLLMLQSMVLPSPRLVVTFAAMVLRAEASL